MKPYYDTIHGKIFNGSALEVLKSLPGESVHCCVTSPPYWGLRDYGVQGQMGIEETPERFVKNMISVFQEVARVLRPDGTLWLNLGDSYHSGDKGGYHKSRSTSSKVNIKNIANNFPGSPNRQPQEGLKSKDLVGIPWRVAFALQDDGWYLRQDIIWHKPNPMPESVTDRCTKAHEYIFLLSKSQRYFYDHEVIKEKQNNHERKRRLRELSKGLSSTYNIMSDGKNGQTPQGNTGAIKSVKRRHELAILGTRNKRSVWTVTTKPFKEAHFATFPPGLIEPCILAGCPKGGTVLDPFFGSGTTGLVAYDHDRKFIGIELNPEYCEMASKRIQKETQQLKLFA